MSGKTKKSLSRKKEKKEKKSVRKSSHKNKVKKDKKVKKSVKRKYHMHLGYQGRGWVCPNTNFDTLIRQYPNVTRELILSKLHLNYKDGPCSSCQGPKPKPRDLTYDQRQEEDAFFLEIEAAKTNIKLFCAELDIKINSLIERKVFTLEELYNTDPDPLPLIGICRDLRKHQIDPQLLPEAIRSVNTVHTKLNIERQDRILKFLTTKHTYVWTA